jgi:predicted small lipoprotein YifL
MTIFKQVLLAALIASSLAACGVRGDPEAPPSFTQQ